MAPDPIIFWLSITAPTIMGIFSFIFNKRSGYLVAFSSVLSLILLLLNINILIEGESYQLGSYVWWPLESGAVTFGLIVDPLSLLMGTIVAFISSLVFIYSIEYMRHEEGVSRFWFFMGCFESSMLILLKGGLRFRVLSPYTISVFP